MSQADRYAGFAELARETREGRDYRRLIEGHWGKIAIVAPHGGGIEPGTSEIARAVAGWEFGLYCFEGLRPEGNGELHIASHRFDEPTGVRLVAQARTVVAVHGCAGTHQAVYTGGLDRDLRERLIAALRRAGFQAERATGERAGCYASNICNRGRSGRGVQLEITEGLRLAMFDGLSWRGRERTTEVFERFVVAVRGVLAASFRTTADWETNG